MQTICKLFIYIIIRKYSLVFFIVTSILGTACREIEFLEIHKNILSTLKLTLLNRKVL